MTYLLDTCTISETYGHNGEPKIVEFLVNLPRAELFLSAVTIGEIQYGIERKNSRQRDNLSRWLAESILAVFSDQILPFDTETAIEWGRLRARLQVAGKTMQTQDSLIAATAIVHGLTVLTRNESDFAPSGLRIFNPWKS